ncbi:hypothetical protein [Nonomuraea gerenzanensis]|uniref:Fe-S oxidoreductase n=1 Tax=Nonomuraea gerenzanensis TaxID=93944 RepID=A0A1M4EQC3_9ACTN|nr:hypothetical protein [Nonomuraea gerenzanensis]UBU12471.1 hypothetical protein LCN96_50755 [Nonomuraea gerenzanensis]SBP01024.1 Fe-S oxidoreductase [Nonomuraea gerenzanensis]
MYRHALAVVTATSAALLATATPVFGAPVFADDTKSETASGCSNHDVFSINVSPPPPLAGSVTAEDIRGLMDAVIAGSRLHGFFTAGAGAPAVPAVPYLAPVLPFVGAEGARHAMPYDPQHLMPGQPPYAVPGQPLGAATYEPGAGGVPQQPGAGGVPQQPGAGGVSPGQPGGGGTGPSQPGSGGPSPSQPPLPSPSASAAPSTSASAAPSTSASAAPSTSASSAPSASAPAAPGLAPSPLNADEEASVSPVQAMFEDLIGRVLVCARATAEPGTEVPAMTEIDTAQLAQYLEGVLSSLPAACSSPSAGTPAAAQSPAQTPAQSPATLLDAIGVGQILSSLTDYPSLCAGPAAAGGSSTSLLDSIGVTSLFKALAG